MHPLDEWLEANDKSRDWLTNKVGASKATISRIISRKQWPSRELCDEIMRITKGAVTPNDFIEPEKRAS